VGLALFEFLFKYSRATFDRSEFLFASGWPLWVLAALIVIAGVGVGFSLVRNRHDLAWWRLGVIGMLQLAVIGGLLTMLWRPALLTQTLRPQENAIALLVDTSASMNYGDGEGSRLQQAVTALEDGPLPVLEQTFKVELAGFAGQTFNLDSLDSVPAPGPRTDIGDALLSTLRGASAGALASIVLVSDGADNSGRLDPARLAEIASFGVPVHTVGVGREVIPEDIELEDVVLAPQSSPGATVTAQVSIRHGRAAQAQLKVYDGDAIVAAEAIDLPDQAGVTTRWIDIDVGNAGVRDLRFTLDPLTDEVDLINNTQLRPLEVPERRRSVLYYEGEPRWEYKFIRRAFDAQSPIRLASLLRTTPNKFYRQGLIDGDELADGFPTEEEDLFAYDAVIIGSLEATALTEEQQQMLYEFVSRRGGTLLMLGGQRGLADGGWGGTVVADVLPAYLPLDAEPSFKRYPVKAILPPDSQSLITRLASDDDENALIWEQMPDLETIQLIPESALKPGHETLLEADYLGDTWPLLVRHRFGEGAAYILATSGTWRWQMQLDHTDMKHETFWRQLVQALTASAPAPVTLTSDRVYYGDETAVTFRADVRDRDYEPATDATVALKMDIPGGQEQTVTMTAVPGMPGRYEATVDAEADGIYRFEADATVDDESLGRSRLAIRREDGVSEHFQVQQNRALLERIAAVTGGRYFTLDNVGDIPEAVQFSDAGVVERRLLDLWNMPILFLMLLGLKAGEWVLRLFWGRL
jgi:uncharacterized membrane protein